MATAPVSMLTVADELLLEVANNIQLPPYLYRRAIERMSTLAEHLDRPESPFRGQNLDIYPQGSMRIGSTVRSLDTADMFDIDLIVEMPAPYNGTPDDLLLLLESAIRGDRGSRYHHAYRQSRCVTIEYNEMHVDLTPLIRTQPGIPRAGVIPHANPEKLNEQHWVHANPAGFGDWFLREVERQKWFQDEFRSRSMGLAVLAEHQVDLPPEQQEVYAKPMAVVGLQLLKRFVQVRYADRSNRRPPSVLLAKWFAEVKFAAPTFLSDLIQRVAYVRQKLLSAPLKEFNPAYPGKDEFTDRWSNERRDVPLFLSDVEHLLSRLRTLENEQPIKTMKDVLSELFGEGLSSYVVEAYAKRKHGNLSGGLAGVAVGSGRVAPTVVGTRTPPIITPAPRRDWGGIDGDDSDNK